MDLNLTDRLPRRYTPNCVEAVTLAYTFFTLLLILLLHGRMDHPVQHALHRLFILLVMAGWWGIYQIRPCRLTLLLRYLFPLSLLGFWYPDTYEFSSLFPNLDHLFAAADQALFGCQPASLFDRVLPGRLWSEVFYLGYFAYYPMIALTVVLPICRGEVSVFKRTAFIVLAGFFLYYLVYLFLPVAGPQFYFPAAGEELVNAGMYPELGDYFRTHAVLPAGATDAPGFFESLVRTAQEGGERPTAAFPSSHVGMSTILMALLYRNDRKLMWAFLPLYLILCASTVYIRAHYLVDVFAGWMSAAIIYFVVSRAYDFIKSRGPQQAFYSQNQPI